MSRRRKPLTNQVDGGSPAPELRKQPAIESTETVQEAQHLPGPEGKQTELEQLQLALSRTLEQLNQLRTENEALSKQLLQERKRSNQLQDENKKANNLLSAQKKAALQSTQLQHRLNMSEKKRALLETRYNALANSKLGRLTLNYWAWHKQKQRGGSLGNFFAVKWLFGRLPSVEQPADLSEVSTSAETSPTTEIKPAPAVEAKLTPVVEVKPAPAKVQKQMDQAQEDWALPYLEQIVDMEVSNGCRYYQTVPIRIGIVCDDFFYDSIEAAANFVYLTPDNWRSELEQGLEALLFVSVWRGLNMEWKDLANLNSLLNCKPTPSRIAAFELLDACHEKGIPTVFYSKEDPPNYELFLDLAKHCDYVFTSAKECIPYYQQDCQREKVEAVCFGVNPIEHNPIGSYRPDKEDTVLFSGSWMSKYKERCEDLIKIFDGIMASGHGLHIIDRNYPGNERYRFPSPYFEHCSPALPHRELQKVHKLFDWAININSVKTSETMFANRAFELQANGILLMSNFSVGIQSILPNVQMVQDSEEVAYIMDGMSPEERYERQMFGVRCVMTGHTCFDRFAQLLRPVGLDTEQPVRRVLVLADELTEQVQRCFDHQSYPERTLMAASEVTESALSDYYMVTWFAPDAKYGVFYLEDMVNGFKYTACDYITKAAWYEGGELHAGTEHGYVTWMESKYRTLFWRAAYDPAFLLNLGGEQALENGYSIDRFQYDAAPVEQDRSRTDYRLSVIIPAYNNGEHLFGKCFCSLRRSTVFSDMEIIIVDDGSTDPKTLLIEEDLADRYPNVRLYRFHDGGSGSASRPRNKGVEMARAPYLTYLDPDNEAVLDGYATLLSLCESERLDLAGGNMYKIGSKTTVAQYYSMITQAAGTDYFEDGLGDALPKGNFFSASIQAMVIRREMLLEHHLEQVTGAVGEDTLFSWQLFQTAKRIHMIDLPIHIYYAETSGSVTNTVSERFFQRTLLIQKPKADWLLENHLLDEFMSTRYNYYTVNWIFAKLARAQDIVACTKIVEQILDVYEPYYNHEEPLINDFMERCKAEDYAGAAKLVEDKFPLHEVRPMPTLDQLSASTRDAAAKFNITYGADGSTFRFTNHSGGEGATYAWVILSSIGAYTKVYSTNYSKDPCFSFDFATLEPGTYKVRAFVKKDGDKNSEDTAFLRVEPSLYVTFLEFASKAQKES